MGFSLKHCSDGPGFNPSGIRRSCECCSFSGLLLGKPSALLNQNGKGVAVPFWHTDKAFPAWSEECAHACASPARTGTTGMFDLGGNLLRMILIRGCGIFYCYVPILTDALAYPTVSHFSPLINHPFPFPNDNMQQHILQRKTTQGSCCPCHALHLCLRCIPVCWGQAPSLFSSSSIHQTVHF